MLRFSQPMLLHLFWLLPLILVGWWWVRQQTNMRIRQVIKDPLVHEMTGHNNRFIQWLIQGLRVMAFVLIVLGLAGPEQTIKASQKVTLGLDIFFLMDTSKSMDAKDVFPSRLERGKRALMYLVDHLEDHRIGIIQFSGESFVSCPFTQDKAALKLIIDAMQSNSLPTPGTDITQGLQLAQEGFARNGARHKIMILISDGETYGAKPFGMIRKNKQAGIRLYTLAVGTKTGTGIMQANAIVTDQQGRPVVTKLKEEQLKKMADFGGGRYWQLTTTGLEEQELVTEINRLEKIKRFTSGYHVWQPLYPWPALLAGLCIVLSLLLSPGKKIKAMTLIGIMVLLLNPQPGHAKSTRQLLQEGLDAFHQESLPEAEQLFEQARKSGHYSALSEYNLGCALLLQKKLRPAYQAFSRAKEQAKGKKRQDILYNLGYTAFFLGLQEGASEYWLEALEAYKSLLMQNPDDDEARYNIEVILREIKKRTKSTAPQQQQSQGQEKGKEPGGGADKPGTDRAQSQGKENKDAPPREAQEESQKRQNQGKQPKTSQEQQGHRQKGMSKQEALRTLNSLEAEETSIQKHWQQQEGQQPVYKGPVW